jgi:hypothetical protein
LPIFAGSKEFGFYSAANAIDKKKRPAFGAQAQLHQDDGLR